MELTSNSPNSEKPNNDTSSQEKSIANGIAIISQLMASHVLVHPFVVLRRQCQVSRKIQRYHLMPFTVIPVIFRIQNLHGLGSLWKGIGSALLVKGAIVLTQGVLSETTPLVKDLSFANLTMDNLAKHLSLKALVFIIVTPLFAASLVETVQSSIAVESPGVLDILRETLLRLTHWKITRSTRLLPIWLLFGPSVIYGCLHYSISSTVRCFVLWLTKPNPEDEEIVDEFSSTVSQSSFDTSMAIADLVGNVVADIAMYPLETILHRLCLQGTRTIIDNTDRPGIVTPLISDYDGVADCYNSVVTEEGLSGLYKGFGALILQYTCQYVFIKCTKMFVQQFI
ncbi:Solute carrier family 25 member 46 [Halotydeus destructor]|nr:Solute carrier family 25 member 46 [Halotydeus destructor]